MTLVAMVCNDPAVQKILPQVLMVKVKSMTAIQWQDVRRDLAPNMYIQRLPSSWMTGRRFTEVLKLLHEILRREGVLHACQPIVCFDAFRGHLDDTVFGWMGILHMWYLVIPAALTWLLQPLDVRVFPLFKHRYGQEWNKRHRQHPDESYILLSIRSIKAAVGELFGQVDWSRAFTDLGLGGDAPSQAHFGQTCDWDPLPPIERDRPTSDTLRLAWPRNCRLDDYWPFVPLPSPAPPPMLALPAPPVAMPPAPAAPAGAPPAVAKAPPPRRRLPASFFLPPI